MIYYFVYLLNHVSAFCSKDVLILGQFVTPEGQILPRSVTGLCGKANSRLEKLVYQARRARMF